MITWLKKPISATVKDFEVMVSALYIHPEDARAYAIWLDDNGQMVTGPIESVVVNVRFRNGEWIDLKPGSEE